FVNPEFYLYQAPVQSNMIFPPQIKKFLFQLSKKASYPTIQTKAMIKMLENEHTDETNFNHVPNYTYKNIKKVFYAKIAVLYCSVRTKKGWVVRGVISRRK